MDITGFSGVVEQLRDLHLKMAQQIQEFMKGAGDLQDQDLVDIGYLARASKDLLEDWRKTAHNLETRCGSTLSMRVTEKSLTNPSVDLTIQGTMARATCDMSILPHLPNQGSEEYFQMMADLGVPREIATNGSIKLDFRKAESYVTKLAEAGQPMPTWVKKTYPVYKATFVRKNA